MNSYREFLEMVARVAHEVNRRYCQSIGDHSQPSWDDIPAWQRESAISGVKAHMASDVTPEQSHALWLEQKTRDGWSWGPVKDPARKEHPRVVAYDELPPDQKTKDFLFSAVCSAFKGSE